jgi:integrase
MKKKLNARTVGALKKLPKNTTDEFYWDNQLDRFGLRLRRGAGDRVLRSYIIQYRHAGATRRMTLGSADVVGAEQARAAARKLLAKVDLGEDPQTARSDRRDKDKHSFHNVVADYLGIKQSDVRASTFRHVRAYLTGPYFKTLHRMPIDRITRRDVAAAFIAIARDIGKPTAVQARTTLSAFFTWCMKTGLVDANPVIGTEQPKAAPARDRVLSDSELAAVWNACGDNSDFARIVRLLILLPCRRAEVGDMCWSELDFDAGSWTIPAARAKNGRAITLPLMPAALNIIQSVPRRAGRDPLFGSYKASGFTAYARNKATLDQRTGLTEPWNIHDIRRSIATRMADLGVTPHVIEQILNHQGGHKAGVAGIYNRSSYEREVKQALAMWADHVRSLGGGGKRKILRFASQARS